MAAHTNYICPISEHFMLCLKLSNAAKERYNNNEKDPSFQKKGISVISLNALVTRFRFFMLSNINQLPTLARLFSHLEQNLKVAGFLTHTPEDPVFLLDQIPWCIELCYFAFFQDEYFVVVYDCLQTMGDCDNCAAF